MAKESEYRSLPQFLCAFAVSFCSSIVGGWVAFTSVAIPKMMNMSGQNHNHTFNESDSFTIDLYQGSWITSLFFIGNIIGCLAGGYINQIIGAKRIFIISAPISAFTWILIALSHELWIILMARIISGVLFGFFQANGKVYNAEIAHPDLRGSLGTILSNMYALGSIYTYILGYLIHSWRLIAWLQVIPCFLLGISVLFVPESPYWLVEKGRYNEAKKSLSVLRGVNFNVNEEFEEILNKKKIKEAKGKTILQTLCSKTFLMPFLRIGSLMIITQWAGINVISSYMVNIFMQAGSSIDPSLAPIFVCGVQQCFATISTAVLRVAPRKPLFLIAASAMAMSQFALGTYSYLSEDLDQNTYGWIPLVCVIILTAFRTVGFMVVIQLTLAESFPTEIRSYASGICGACTAINMFGATKLYPHFLESLGFHGTFWMYGCVMVIEVIYGALTLPENKGLSLVKTEDKMINNNHLNEQDEATTFVKV